MRALNLLPRSLGTRLESTRLPPMWPEFKSRRRRHMWVEFVVGSLPCSERFFSEYSGFSLSSKTNISKFQFAQESGRRRTTMWMCYPQIVIYLFIIYPPWFSESVTRLFQADSGYAEHRAGALAERVWSLYLSLVNIYFRLSEFQSSLLLIYFRDGPNSTLHVIMAQNLSDMLRSTFGIGAEHLHSVKEIAPPQLFLCVKRSPARKNLFHMTSQQPYLCTKQRNGGHIERSRFVTSLW